MVYYKQYIAEILQQQIYKHVFCRKHEIKYKKKRTDKRRAEKYVEIIEVTNCPEKSKFWKEDWLTDNLRAKECVEMILSWLIARKINKANWYVFNEMIELANFPKSWQKLQTDKDSDKEECVGMIRISNFLKIAKED